MAGYDPKRPRPSVSDDDAPAPVDAILDATTGQVPVVVVDPASAAVPDAVTEPPAPDAVAEPEPEPDVVAEPEPEPEPEPDAVAEPEPEPDAVAEPEPEPDAVAEPEPDAVPEPDDSGAPAVAASEPERHLRSVPAAGASDVPIAAPPAEPTANRAVVVVAAGVAALLAVLAIVVLRRRGR